MVVIHFKVFASSDAEGMEETEIRRFSVDSEETKSFTVLVDKIQRLFPDLKDKGLEVFWIDDEMDRVKMSNDEDFIEAVRVTADKAVLYMNITVVEDMQEEPAENCRDCDSSEAVFECSVCEDVKLCMECKENEIHEEHELKRIEPGKKPNCRGTFRRYGCFPRDGMMGARGGGMMGCQRGMMRPRRGRMGCRGGMTGPRGGMMGPRGGMMGPRGGMMGCREGMTGPRGGMMGCRGGMMGPRGGMMGCRGGMMGPRGGMMGCREGMTGPRGGMMGCRGGMMGPRGGMMSCHGGLMGPEARMMGPEAEMMGCAREDMMEPRGFMAGQPGCPLGPREEMMA